MIALALHVDYWDYIGWKDTFASPQYTQRQKLYARAAGHRTIYTPQMVIEGEDHVVGYRPMEVAELIEAHHARPAPAQVTLSRSAGVLKVSLAASGRIDGPVGGAVGAVRAGGNRGDPARRECRPHHRLFQRRHRLEPDRRLGRQGADAI